MPKFSSVLSKSFIALTTCMVALSAHASGLAQLKAFGSKVQSAQGDFVQRQVKTGSTASEVKVTQTSSGKFAFARPGKFVWQYTKPYEQVLQADGNKLYIWDKDLNQVTTRKLGDALASSPAAILFGSNDLNKHFVVQEGGTKQGIDWVQLTPRNKDSQFQKIGIGFKGGQLEGMELRDAFGNTTLLTFSHVVKNPKLPASTFQFDKPKGADVIQQ